MKLPSSLQNFTSLTGAVIAGFNFILIIFFFIIIFFFDVGGSYVGIFVYMVLPIFLIGGLILIPIGALINIRKNKKTDDRFKDRRLIINFNDKRHRNAFLIFLISTTIFLILSSVGSYEAFHYSESVEFCGICHSVMDPEHIAHENSSHANVSCVECHVGPGADWYVRSKLSGMYQVYSVLFKKYPTPIPTPISDLRPASETCLECHWPEKFYPHKLEYEKHFLTDENNSEWNINLRMKIASTHSSQGQSEGIHWHINKNVKIEYISSSSDREVIPWVRYINLKTGDTTIYNDMEEPIEEELLASATPRTMDCMDCHNRPSHNFETPQGFVDKAMANGEIPVELPNIKLLAMQIFVTPFEHKDSALMFIEDSVNSYYAIEYPDVYANNKELIDRAIVGLKDGFSKNIYPEMKASWDSYPDHIGHLVYNGCFRCHNGNHESESGKVISRDCNLCHTILLQGFKDSLQVAKFDSSLEFQHPVNIKKRWKRSTCADCHRNLYE